MSVPEPSPPPDPERLPSAVTFFLSAGQRRMVLAALRAIDRDRTLALLRMLEIERGPTDERRGR